MTRPYGKHHLTGEQRKLAEDNLPLVWWFIQRRLTSRGLIKASEIDDVSSYLMFYLCRAAERYEPTQCKFSTYAIHALWRAFTLYRKERDKYQSNVRLTDFVVDTGGRAIADTMPDKTYLDEPCVCWTDVSKLFDKIDLTDNEAHLVDLYYRERKGPVEMARLLGKTPSNIMTVLRKVRNKIRQHIKQTKIPVEHFTERQIT